MSTITVAGINPGLNILGATQQFNYTQSLSTFQITNSFIPSISIPSQFNQEIRNNLFSGFRWSHVTTSTDTYGSLTLQSFVNAQSTGTDIMKFDNSGISILATLNMNSQPITNSTWNGNTITVPYGGTGIVSTTAYALICGGTTSTGNLQSVTSLGSTGQVLTSQGAAALPIWTTNGSGTVTSITAGAGLSGGTITTSGTIDITDTAVTPGTYTGSFTVNSRGQLTAASNTLTGVLASLYMSGNNTATSVVANTPTKIVGTTISGTLISFTMPAVNKLQYGGPDPITAMVSVDLSASAATLSATLGIMIYKNGSLVPAANYNYQLTVAKPLSLTVRTPVSFVATDFVEVFITSDNTDNVTVSDMNLSVAI
jgi:hypothetical protein